MNIGEINGVQVAVSPEAYEEIKKQKIIEENKILKEQKQEIEKLNNIIKEVREYIDKWKFEAGGNGACMNYDDIVDILEILDKENK